MQTERQQREFDREKMNPGSIPMEMLKKSVLDFPTRGKPKRDVWVPPKIKRLSRSILAVHPCTAGIAELSGASLFELMFI